MPVWLVAVKLGMADGSEGFLKGARQVMSKADKRAHDEAVDEANAGRGVKGRAKKIMGRFDPSRATPRTSDPGTVLRGDDAR
jgi:hypothetical protein